MITDIITLDQPTQSDKYIAFGEILSPYWLKVVFAALSYKMFIPASLKVPIYIVIGTEVYQVVYWLFGEAEDVTVRS